MLLTESPNAAPGLQPSLRRPVLVFAFALAVLHVVLAWIQRAPGIEWIEDDAEYAILARDLTAGSYRDRWDISAPVHARYPPAFPAMLAMTNKVAGEHLDVQVALVIACSALSLLLLFDVARRRIGDSPALLVLGLCAINPSLLGDAGSLMTEAPFRLWFMLTLWGASRDDGSGSKYAALAGTAAILAALTRSVGIAVIAGLGVHWLLQRRWKSFATLTVAALVLVGSWLVWTVVSPDHYQRNSYMLVFTGDEESESRWQRLKWQALNAWQYFASGVPGSMGFFALRANRLDNMLWAGFAVATLPVGFVVLWRRWRILALLCLSYGGLLAFWPWFVPRFVNPAAGLILVVMVTGALTVTRRWGPRAQHVAMGAIAALFIVGAWQVGGTTFRAMVACDRARPIESASCYAEDSRGLLGLTQFSRDATPADAIFLTPKAGAFYYHSGRRAINAFRALEQEPANLASFLRGEAVSYVVVTTIGGFSSSRNLMLALACREFDLVRSFVADTHLLRMRPGPLDHDDAACEVLARWRHPQPA